MKKRFRVRSLAKSIKYALTTVFALVSVTGTHWLLDRATNAAQCPEELAAVADNMKESAFFFDFLASINRFFNHIATNIDEQNMNWLASSFLHGILSIFHVIAKWSIYGVIDIVDFLLTPNLACESTSSFYYFGAFAVISVTSGLIVFILSTNFSRFMALKINAIQTYWAMRSIKNLIGRLESIDTASLRDRTLARELNILHSKLKYVVDLVS